MNILEEKLLSAEKVALTGHVSPDGDCIGSLLSLYNYISTVYPKIKISAYLEEFNDKFLFLKNSRRRQRVRSAHLCGFGRYGKARFCERIIEKK